MQMKRLEEQVSAPLFQKRGRAQVLTTQGEALVGYARKMLALEKQAIGAVQQADQERVVRIGCPEDYAQGLLPELLEAIARQHPATKFSVITANSQELRGQLDKNALDISLITRTPGSDEGYLLMHSDGVWAKARASKEPLSTDPLVLALYDDTCKFNSSAQDLLQKQGVNYQVYCATNSLALLKRIAKQKGALIALARASLDTDLTPVQSKWLPKLPSVELALVTPAQCPTWLTEDWLKTLINDVNLGRSAQLTAQIG